MGCSNYNLNSQLIIYHFPATFVHFGFESAVVPSAIANEEKDILFGECAVVDEFDGFFEITTPVEYSIYRFRTGYKIGPAMKYK